MNYGFIRVASASPEVIVGDCTANTTSLISLAHQAIQKNIQLIVFPELCITGYTCGDLFFQQTLQQSARINLERYASETKSLPLISIVGLPIAYNNALYNCAAVIFKGDILAIIPKTYIPNYSEFYERRHFSPAPQTTVCINLSDTYKQIPFGTHILITDTHNPAFCLACEICEDVWVPLPPSTQHALNGATIIANPSASNEIIGKASYRTMLIQSQSGRIAGAYIYADAGHGESTQDVVFAGHNIIAENGSILKQSQLFDKESFIYADIDVERLQQERRKITTYVQTEQAFSTKQPYTTITVTLPRIKQTDLARFIDPHPFVPSDIQKRTQRCQEVITLQAEGLAKRLRHTHAQHVLIGLSGGLDSTLALLVTCKAYDICNLPHANIHAVTMPCFGTTDRTYNNACALAKYTNVTLSEIPITKSVRQHFNDIGVDETVHDVTYENCQARERTQVLMDLANKYNGMVIGTGDLSELALGWATYNGDHMSMYGVNSSIPKTLVRYLVSWFADEATKSSQSDLAHTLHDILDTPVSPELLPPTDGSISQKTEDIVGPYELHDFFLYYVLRFGFTPTKIFFLAQQAFKDTYTKDIILKWLAIFYRRFFSQQFKRSCLPDGAKVGTVSLSPRGDWRMPSDASSAIWLAEIDTLIGNK
ncbi:MAG: NAD(+) synthase [Treponema sp.]|nr:NAD(+) synthase [Treponema sp.]